MPKAPDPLTCSHLVLNVSDVKAARAFYVDKLGLEILEEAPKFLALKAGDVRISLFPGGTKLDMEKEAPNLKPILRTQDLDREVKRLRELKVVFEGEIQEAPGFMRHIAFSDPDNNMLFLGQYLADPLKEKP